MKNPLTIAAAIAFLMCLVIGCSEDPDCPVAPSSDSPSLYITGDVEIEGNSLKALIEIHNIDGSDARVDSAFVDGDFSYWCIRDVPGTIADDGRQLIAHLGSEYCPTGVLPNFTTGAITRLTFFCRGVEHGTELHLLDQVASTPANLNANVNETPNTVNINWDGVNGAEWYSIRMKSKFNFAGPWTWSYFSSVNEYIEAPLPIPYDQIAYLDIYVAAGTGPMPDEGRPVYNISGEHMRGSVYSVSNEAYRYLEVTPLVAR